MHRHSTARSILLKQLLLCIGLLAVLTIVVRRPPVLANQGGPDAERRTPEPASL